MQNQNQSNPEELTGPVSEIEIDFPEEPVKETPVTESVRKPNVQIEEEICQVKELEDTDARMFLPAESIKTLNDKVDVIRKKIEETADTLLLWGSVLKESTESYLGINPHTEEPYYESRFTDPDSHFRQGVEVDGRLLNTSSVNLKASKGEIKGDMALLKVAQFLGLGETRNVLLPHSGIWVSIKPPTERDLIDLYNKIFVEKQQLGRETNGIMFTNLTVYSNDVLVDFAIRCVHTINYSDIEKSDLRDHILIHDLPILLWGVASTMYPSGFNYQRSCTSDPENCNHIETGNINLNKIIFIDNNALTARQKELIGSMRPNSLKKESYTTYVSEHLRTKPDVYKAQNGMIFKFKIPTISEHITDGRKWIDYLSTKVEELMLENGTDDEETKNGLLSTLIRSGYLSQYSHFIERISLGENDITDRDSVEKTIEMISGDDQLRNELDKAIIEFKTKTTIAIIGVPTYDCPKCGGRQQVEYKQDSLKEVIPLDVAGLFFLMFTSRVERITTRNT